MPRTSAAAALRSRLPRPRSTGCARTARARPRRGSSGPRSRAGASCSSGGCAPRPTRGRSSPSTPAARRARRTSTPRSARPRRSRSTSPVRAAARCCCRATGARRCSTRRCRAGRNCTSGSRCWVVARRPPPERSRRGAARLSGSRPAAPSGCRGRCPRRERPPGRSSSPAGFRRAAPPSRSPAAPATRSPPASSSRRRDVSAAAPPRDPFRAPLGQAIRAQTRRPQPPPPPAAVGLGAPAVRLACVLLAGGLALHQWLGMIAGPPRGALLGVLAVVALLGAGLLAASRVRWRVRRGALVVLALGAAAAALLGLAGVPGADLDPRGWSALATGIGDGIAALPGVTVPYEGNAEWVRIVLAAGGMLLLALAVAAAVWPRRPVPGSRLVTVAGLAVLYAVPAVELNLDHPWRAGALFTVALVAVLHAERLSLERAPLAIGALGVVVVAGLVLSPKLDGAKPVIDVQELATQLQSHDEISFTWDHRYGPLDWPRTGRELLRVRAGRQAYWKAQSLEDFDGVHWNGGPGTDRLQFRHPEWIQRISVTVSDLRTRQFIGSGSTQKIIGAPEDYIPASAGSFISTGRSLENGDAYEADV